MKSTQKIFMTQLRYPFGISRGVDTELPTVLYRIGDAGMGEGSPVRYKQQKAEDVVSALAEFSGPVTDQNIDDIEEHDARARKAHPDRSAAIAAFNITLWDARGRRAGKAIYELLGTEKPVAQTTTYTVSLSDYDTMVKRTEEAAHLPALKIKLGRDEEFDIEVMKRIRKAAPNCVLRVDANAGWSLQTAMSIIPILADLGVQFVEQPVAIGALEDLHHLHKQSPLPIIADEDAQDLNSLKALRGRCSGINIKLMKCGGISEALKMIEFARQEGWKILIGCMIETRLALGAASHMAGLVDYMDVDAHMLTKNDPFPPGSQEQYSGALPLSDGPGVGLPMIDF
ncbi:dipeptide epimerase [soil metagenome]